MSTDTYPIMSTTDFDTVLVSALRQVAKGEQMLGQVLHSAIRAVLWRADLAQLNAIINKMDKLALKSVVIRAALILTGGYYETSNGDKYFRAEDSCIRYEAKAFVMLPGDAPRTRAQERYPYWHNQPLRGITVKTPELPLTLEPVRKYLEKLQKSGSKWADTDRAKIKAYIALCSDLFGDDNTDGLCHVAAQTATITGAPVAPQALHGGVAPAAGSAKVRRNTKKAAA